MMIYIPQKYCRAVEKIKDIKLMVCIRNDITNDNAVK